MRSWTCKGQSSRSCLTSAYKPRADVSVVSHHLSGWTNTCPSGTSWSDPHPFAKSARLNPCLTADLPLFPQAYDFAGGWSDVTSHQAQLFGPPSEPSVDAAVSFYRSRGVRPDKLVIGASFHISLSLCDTRLTSSCVRMLRHASVRTLVCGNGRSRLKVQRRRRGDLGGSEWPWLCLCWRVLTCLTILLLTSRACTTTAPSPNPERLLARTCSEERAGRTTGQSIKPVFVCIRPSLAVKTDSLFPVEPRQIKARVHLVRHAQRSGRQGALHPRQRSRRSHVLGTGRCSSARFSPSPLHLSLMCSSFSFLCTPRTSARRTRSLRMRWFRS